jgi:predicted alpha-1,2-mannosidase
MKRFCCKFFVLVLLTIAFVTPVSAQTKLIKYVNPMIGTNGHGHTYPGATLPFGMVQLSPDTDIKDWDWCSGYHYSDNSIMGFSHTHLSGTGCADYGDILFMPVTGELKMEPGDKKIPGSGYRSRFEHKNEYASPGYYSVVLDDYKIKVELTATTRAGFHKYTFPESEQSRIILDLDHGIQTQTIDAQINILDNKTIEGYKRSTGWAKDHCVYFVAEFSKPFKSFGIFEDGKNQGNAKTSRGKNIKAYFDYSTSMNEAILVKVGISFVSIEGARKNLKTEIPGWDFNLVKKHAESEWEKELSKITVQDKSQKNKNIFYTALYHALITPNTFSDVDGNYTGMDGKIHSVKNSDMYTVFSLWDTFRAEHPLFTIIDPRRDNDMVKSLIAKYEESGLLPVWELASNETGTMIGYHSIPVIVDAYFKGIRDFDVEKAFEAMKKSAMQNNNGLEYYKEMGYIPADLENESVSKTLEYAYDDWCIAKMAKALGKNKDYDYFIDRAKFYINLFDPSTSLMRAKKNGKWIKPFDPYSISGNYTEANAWQYSFFVPQDINNLINLMKGDDNFISALDTLFSTNPELKGRYQPDVTGLIGQYAHGNEPSHHMAYLYNYAGAPWKTQEKVNEILAKLYTEKTDGLCGNDDCGQMSAWYVLSSAGFYPVCPGSDEYVIGTPHFEKLTIKLDNGKKFIIETKNLTENNFYIQSAKLNGKDYPFSYIKHSTILDGGMLIFEMGSKPGKWGIANISRPKSFIDFPFVSVPFLTSGERVFKDSVSVALSSIDGSAEIFYSVDGSNPEESRRKYISPLIIKNSAELKSDCYKDGKFSKIVTSSFTKLAEGRSIKLNTQFNHNYTGGGPLGLIDGIKGNENFHTDAWQGYEGADLDAIIDLGKVEKVNLISADFLQNTGSWIFFPFLIEYYTSLDGKNFNKVYEINNILDEKNLEQGIKSFSKNLDGADARYIKVYAKNIGVCPAWHPGAGSKAWLFIDEISIK